MDIKEIHKKLDKQCPSDYKINEIISFAYPFRRIKVKATVNKSPEKSIQQVYSVFLRAINIGYNTEEKIIDFLGLHKEDFILRELYFLRERGFVDLVSGIWLVTEQGNEFIKDNSILKILEEEDFEFLIDTISNEAVEYQRVYSDKTQENKLEPEYNFEHKSEKLLDGKNEQLSDIYKRMYQGKAYLVDYDKSNIKYDEKVFQNYYLTEYIPRAEKENELEPFIEIRNIDNDFSKEKRITKILSKQYPNILYNFSISDRNTIAKIQEENTYLIQDFIIEETKPITETQTLSIWETQAKFEETIKTVKSKLLIESPWIKRATLKYINDFEKALKRNVIIVVLYGIEGNDEHHRKAEKEMERLDSQFKNFHLFHLPTHFEEQGNYDMTGTHRKLIIKDNEYYIQGSFNFLSFNREKGQKIANEESILIPKKVKEKWVNVFEEYKIDNKILDGK